MNRQHINRQISLIVERHTARPNGIPTINIPLLKRDLVALMDETVETALSETEDKR